MRDQDGCLLLCTFYSTLQIRCVDSLAVQIAALFDGDPWCLHYCYLYPLVSCTTGSSRTEDLVAVKKTVIMVVSQL